MDRIREIARSVRRWVENLAYHETCVEDHDLTGYCAIASGELFERLVEAGYKPEIRMARDNDDCSCHVFVVVDDYIVDVTATQFRPFTRTPVLISHERHLQEYWFYGSRIRTFSSVAQLERDQRKDGWPSDQIVLVKKHKKNKTAK